MPNRLADSRSAYLRQHAGNPVDWWPWGDEAFEEARFRQVPVLLSVGYSACHWCHVMAHESFEDAQVAGYMNEHFVNIKVDREERPDVDAVYMAATTAMTGQGGWPMTVFLDHERRAFYAGTYFPPRARHGMPAFSTVLEAISSAWQHRRLDLGRTAEQVAHRLSAQPPPPQPVGEEQVSRAVALLHGAFDPVYGGFGPAPKFPQPMVHEFLLRHHARTGDPAALEMVDCTLTAMAAGGMYDVLAGGFARYSVDARWLVPHFEKMLYDNALLLRVYLHWWRATSSALAQRVVEETAGFLLAELRTTQGCFAASLDADSEGREGAFYVWTPEQIRAAGGESEALGVTQEGTFEHGSSILRIAGQAPADWPELRKALLRARSQRPRPARDDKVVLSWNAWAVAALAEAGALLDRPAWVAAAVECRDMLWDVHAHDGGLFRVSMEGARGDAPAVLEDYAALALAEFVLAGVTGAEPACGLDLVAQLGPRFLDHGRDTAAADVPAVPADMTDNATPSGWSLAADALLTASALTGDAGMRDRAHDVLRRAAHLVDHPQFWGHGLGVAEALLDGPREIAVAAPVGSAMHRVALAATAPGAVVALSGPLLAGRTRRDGHDTAYVCRGFVCDAPTTDVGVLSAAVGAARR